METRTMRDWLIATFKGRESDRREHDTITRRTDDETIRRLIARNYPGGMAGWSTDHNA